MFEAGISCVEESKYMKTTVTSVEWEEVLAYLAKLTNDNNIIAPTKIPIDMKKPSVIAKDQPHSSLRSDTTCLIFPHNIPIMPVLKDGQHKSWKDSVFSKMMEPP